MEPVRESRYILASGTQVRKEDFGLLFYTMAGPRLHFLFSDNLLDSAFFQGELALDQWIPEHTEPGSAASARIPALKKTLNQLKEKGVILEC